MLPLSDSCLCGFSDDSTRQNHASGSQMVLRLCKLSQHITKSRWCCADGPLWEE